MPNDINVNRNTTLAQLHDFARDAGDNARLRGRRNDDGSIQLYIKTGKPSFFSKISPGAISHRSLAREAVRTAFNNTDREAGQAIVGDNLRKALSTGMRNDMKGLSLKILSEAGQGVKASNRGPGLAECGTLKDNLDGIAYRLKHSVTPEDRNAVARDLGAMVARDFKANNTGQEERLVLSHGMGLKYDLREALGAHIGLDKVSLDFVDKVFARAAHELSPNKLNDDGSLTLNGKTYQRGAQLGQGAFGKVFSYRADDGTTIALKLPIVIESSDRTMRQVRADMVDEFAGEVRAHRDAMGNGHPNITKLEGVIRTPDGDLGIALESLPRGSAFDAMEKIQEKVDAGVLSQHAANAIRMTLFHDIASGLAHMQEGGMTHLDFKSPNCLIGEDGVARVADFGTSKDTASFRTAEHKRPDNPQWVAPELIKSGEDVNTAIGLNRDRGDIVNSIADRFKSLGTVSRTFIDRVQNYDIDQTKAGMNLHVDAGKTDVWALGVTGFNLVFGHEMVREDGGGRLSEDAQRIRNFGLNHDNRAINTNGQNGVPDTGHSFANSSGSAVIDDLLNQLLHPDPGQRPDMTQVLDHPAFKMPGTGSDMARTLIKELLSDTPNDARIMALSQSFAPPRG